MGLSTTIKKKWMQEKLRDLEEDGFFYEFKLPTDYWAARLKPPEDHIGTDMVFLVEALPSRFRIAGITKVKAESLKGQKYERYLDAFDNPDELLMIRCERKGCEKKGCERKD